MPRSYRDFPESYFQLLSHFEGSRETLTLRGEEAKELASRRRDLYRFFESLSKAASSGDTFAERLSKTSRNLTIGYEKDPPKLVIKINAISRMLENLASEEGEKKIEKKKETQTHTYDEEELKEIMKGMDDADD